MPMTNFDNDQALLSERLLLLNKLDLNYSDHRASNGKIEREMKLLDTIALLLSTGLPGDHFAAAFDKRQHLEIILAKNGSPTSEDIADARELFLSLRNPRISKVGDLYPFVARRCRASVVKRIRKLRASIIDTGFYDDFHSRLDQDPLAREPLTPSAIEREFCDEFGSMAEDYTGTTLSAVLRGHLEGTVDATAVSGVPDLQGFMDIYAFASTVADSRFLVEWVCVKAAGYQKVQRFQRYVRKFCRYIHDVRFLVKGAKRLGEMIKYRWVTDESLGIQVGEEDIHILAATPEEAAHRATVLSSQQLEELKERKPSLVEPWQRTVHTCLHAEIRIILYFGRPSMSGVEDCSQPIGLSKPSCLCCALWMAAHNLQGSIWWETRSRSYKPDPTWAFTARACPNIQDLDLVTFDEKVVSGVLQWLQLRYASGTDFRQELYQIDKPMELRKNQIQLAVAFELATILTIVIGHLEGRCMRPQLTKSSGSSRGRTHPTCRRVPAPASAPEAKSEPSSHHPAFGSTASDSLH
ncbi:hypothetical protein AGABI1DRAFT_131103 [Agaricus bisporus var. burnettii JB137-S8]|uniref:Uncharacterized protein n=1 Tax=Agaricus bisporus var. burnettii (strain JB137-S8 / ATCC MYA-4627 / FGSC 10392) TaxID=597362 RepID=K5X0X9_AGABU|nr:uncharacterized protein AGABI1DRAFT_131103 [Agaricus bisporus var. burnettii JB137-S8]EKM76547.1 hypothetical protein AGABI1DRAFT_131103 [Agaricus bisporus var. burnettii JB137-S8]